MGNQAPPVTDAVQDRHVEKVILSGTAFQSAILGHGAHRITNNAPPVFYTDPVISGWLFPISELFCDEGAFNSSPRATITYQWKKDTIDIPTETSNTYTTIIGDIGSDITCEVTLNNSTGSDTGLSNILTMAAVTDTFVYTLDIMPIEGMAPLGRADMNVIDISVITGMAHLNAIDVNASDVLVVTGIAADERLDVNVGEPYILTGVAIYTAESVNEADAYIMTGTSSPDTETTNVIGAYIMFVPTLLTPLVVVNGDAENSDMSDWTMDTGNVTSETGGGWDVTRYREGLRYFHPEALGQGVDSQMSQVIDIPAGDWTDVDTGRCYCVARFLHITNQLFDYLKVTLEALDAADAVLNTAVYDAPPSEPAEWWVRDTTIDNPLSLPTLTRKVKIIVLFDANASGSEPNSVYADDFHIELMKIE